MGAVLRDGRWLMVVWAASAVSAARGQCELAWSGVGGGVAGRVRALLAMEAPVGGALIAAGKFEAAGGTPARNIARWDGGSWAALGGGVGAEAHSLAIFDDGSGKKLYVGGEFQLVSGRPISYIARWDGVSWSGVGGGTNDFVLALAVYDDGLGGGAALYAGGCFPHAGGSTLANRIARWDGSAWSALGTGMNGFVRGLAVYRAPGGVEELIAGGQFTAAGGAPANRVARWDGARWAALGEGLDNAVYALAVYDDGSGEKLYAGGFFLNAGGAPAQRIARWDGARWEGVGGGMNSDVTALAVFDGFFAEQERGLYAGGLFTLAGTTPVNRVARWDGARWSRLGSGVGANFVYALARFDDGRGVAPHVGGDFAVTGAGAEAVGIARADAWALGDSNGDRRVNFGDITTTLSFWGISYGTGTGPGDGNGDGAVNIADLSATLTGWGSDCGM